MLPVSARGRSTIPYLLCCQAERRVLILCACVALGWFNPETLDLLLLSGPPPLDGKRPARFGSLTWLRADKSPRGPVATSHTNLQTYKPPIIFALLASCAVPVLGPALLVAKSLAVRPCVCLPTETPRILPFSRLLRYLHKLSAGIAS